MGGAVRVNLECQVETHLPLFLGHGWESMWLCRLWADLKYSGHHRSLNRDRLTVTQSNLPETRWDAEQAQMTSVRWL